MSKLTAAQVSAIRREWAESTERSLNQVGARYNVSVSTISAIVKRRTWKDEGALRKGAEGERGMKT